MTPFEYFLTMGKHLDSYYLPEDDDKILNKLIGMLKTDIPDYYNRNIEPELAAELVAQKLNLKMNTNKQ